MATPLPLANCEISGAFFEEGEQRQRDRLIGPVPHRSLAFPARAKGRGLVAAPGHPFGLGVIAAAWWSLKSAVKPPPHRPV